PVAASGGAVARVDVPRPDAPRRLLLSARGAANAPRGGGDRGRVRGADLAVQSLLRRLRGLLFSRPDFPDDGASTGSALDALGAPRRRFRARPCVVDPRRREPSSAQRRRGIVPRFW